LFGGNVIPKMIKQILLICVLILLVGCVSRGSYNFTCYDTREPMNVITIEVSALNEYSAMDIAHDKCQDRLSKIVVQRTE